MKNDYGKDIKQMKGINDFKNLIFEILRSDKNYVLNWDEIAGEDWTWLYNKKLGITCMLHVKVCNEVMHY